MFKFNLNQEVNVQLFDTTTKGVIHRRIMQETLETNMVSTLVENRYWVYIESIEDYVEPQEESLVKLNKG